MSSQFRDHAPIAVLGVILVSCSSDIQGVQQGPPPGTGATGGSTMGVAGAAPVEPTAGTGAGGATTAIGGAATAVGGAAATIGGATTASGGTAGNMATATGGTSTAGTGFGGMSVGGVSSGGTSGASGGLPSLAGGGSGAAPDPSPGCGVPWAPDDVEVEQPRNGPSRQVVRRNITINDVVREYLVSVPEPYDASKAYALVFAFHGRGGDREQLRGYMNMEPAVAAEGIVIYPGGLVVDGSDTGWDLGSDSDDLLFVDGLLETYTAELCVDRARVFATGHSFGGCMSNSLGCFRGDVFRAIAPVAGCGPFGRNNSCVGQIASLVVHSPYDTVEDYSSAVNACTRSMRANSCDEMPECGCYWDESLDGADSECLQEAQQPYLTGVTIEVTDRDEREPVLREYLNCDAGYPVVTADHWRRERQTVGDPGERWHNPPPWAPALIWEFFDRLPRVEPATGP